MPKFKVSKSTTINAPVEQVFKSLNQFSNWQEWSPWLISEPEATVKVAEGEKYYEWEGKRVGKGNMKVTGEKENRFVDYDLEFLKPWKSKAKVKFNVEPDTNGTKVTWSMDSALPFFMFWMKKMMISFVGMDYQRGLLMLKDFSEEGKVASKLEFKGSTNYPGCTYVGLKTSCAIDQLKDSMERDASKLEETLKEEQGNVASEMVTVYHKWDVVNNRVEYTFGAPVNSIPTNLPTEFVAGKLPKTSTNKIKHTGAYRHLGNAWSAQYMMERNKEFKKNKNIDPFEIYLNDPRKVNENELLTEVYFPTK